MRTKLVRIAALAGTALIMFGATPAWAQEAAGADAGTGDIVVTARRVEERLQDVPISITVFSQEQVAARNIVNASDLGIYTPSLTTNFKFGPEKASFVIRGFVQDAQTQPSASVYFADVVAPRANGLTASGNGVNVGNLFDLQNIQVLKGPQGTLFGRNTTGGAVLLVPQKPTDRLEGYVEGSIGNYDMRRAQGVINLPLADTFKVRLGVDHMKRDGYLRNRSGIGPDRLGNSDYIAARLSIVADITPDLENYTIATYALSDNNGVIGRIKACNPASPFAPLCNVQFARQTARGDGYWDVESTEPDPLIRNKTWQVINTTTWRASDALTIKNIASYGEFYETSRYNLIGDDFTLPNNTLALELVRTNDTPGYKLVSQATYTEELQFQGVAAGGKLTWQAGAYFENSDPLGYSSQASLILLNCPDYRSQMAATFSVQCPASASGSISVPFQKIWFRNRGLYVQGTYALTDKLAVTGGFRYTWDEMRQQYDGTTVRFPTSTSAIYSCSNAVRVTNPDGSSPVVISGFAEHPRCAINFTAKSNKPTWLIDLEYKPIPDVMVYAKWARGYRAGGVAAANILMETFGPEKVDTYEVGVKTSFRGSAVKGYFNLTGFYNDFRDQQILASLSRNPRPGNPFVSGTAIINAGKSRIWGVEVDTSVTFFDSLKVDVGYTYLNTRLLDLDVPPIAPEAIPFYLPPVPTAVVGEDLALSPRNRLTLTGTYTLPLDESIGRISFGATFVHTDSQTVTRAVPARFGTLPGSDLLNLNANWTDVMDAPVDLSFFMTNVTNAKFPLSTSSAFNTFGIETQLTNVPRMWGFRMKYRFGS
jgi:iron complex outermembrane receptor protein